MLGDELGLEAAVTVARHLDGQFAELAGLPGVTNHRIGDSHISGGIRDCGAGAEAVLATADWSALVAVRLRAGQALVTPVSASATSRAFARALACHSQ